MMEHTGSRPFACSICSRQFRTKHVLERHLSTHSDERPFACDRCRKCFKLKKYLDAHRLTHSGSRYVCNLCCKPFSSEESLSRHTCKSYVVQPDAGGTSAGQPPTTTTDDDRIVQVQISVESGPPGDQMVHYYVCASCREGYVDVDEAIGHVCRNDDDGGEAEGDVGRPSDELPSQLDATVVSDAVVMGGDPDRRQQQDDVVNAGEPVGQFAVIADGVSAVPLTSILAESTTTSTATPPQTDILDSESLLEGGPLDDAGLLPNQQFVLLEQEAAVLAEGDHLQQQQQQQQQQQESEEQVLQTGPEDLPVEMYMCGLCSLLFNSQTDIQQHLQVHASELAGANGQINAHGLDRTDDQMDASQLAVTDGDAQLLLTTDNIGLDKERVPPIVGPMDGDVAMDACHDDVTDSVSSAAVTMVLPDRGEDGIVTKDSSRTELVPME